MPSITRTHAKLQQKMQCHLSSSVPLNHAISLCYFFCGASTLHNPMRSSGHYFLFRGELKITKCNIVNMHIKFRLSGHMSRRQMCRSWRQWKENHMQFRQHIHLQMSLFLNRIQWALGRCVIVCTSLKLDSQLSRRQFDSHCAIQNVGFVIHLSCTKPIINSNTLEHNKSYTSKCISSNSLLRPTIMIFVSWKTWTVYELAHPTTTFQNCICTSVKN